MTQYWIHNTYQADHRGDSDIEAIVNNFATLRSNSSGTGSPANSVAGMTWMDTTNKLLKVRNSANSSWLGCLMGNSNVKVAIYSASSDDGWVMATGSLSDRVLAVKGGSTYTTGGATAGTWTISGIVGDNESTDGYSGHNHKYVEWRGTGAGNQSWYYNSAGTLTYCWNFGYTKGSGWNIGESKTDAWAWTSDAWVKRASHTHTATSDGSWRPAAAVVGLQYLNA